MLVQHQHNTTRARRHGVLGALQVKRARGRPVGGAILGGAAACEGAQGRAVTLLCAGKRGRAALRKQAGPYSRVQAAMLQSASKRAHAVVRKQAGPCSCVQAAMPQCASKRGHAPVCRRLCRNAQASGAMLPCAGGHAALHKQASPCCSAQASGAMLRCASRRGRAAVWRKHGLVFTLQLIPGHPSAYLACQEDLTGKSRPAQCRAARGTPGPLEPHATEAPASMARQRGAQPVLHLSAEQQASRGLPRNCCGRASTSSRAHVQRGYAPRNCCGRASTSSRAHVQRGYAPRNCCGRASTSSHTNTLCRSALALPPA